MGDDEGLTDLGSVGEESRFLVGQLDGLGVEIDSSRPVARSEGLVALVFQVDSFLRHDYGDSRRVSGGWRADVGKAPRWFRL